MANKNSIRKHILNVRNDISLEDQLEWSRKITERFFSLEDISYANIFYLYAAYGKEVLTQETIEALFIMGKRIALPRVDGNSMEFYEIHGYDELRPGFHGILEPQSSEKINISPDIIVMPGVAFDENRNRIGYGKGYYDRYLSKISGCTCLAFAFECQIVDSIPNDAFDVRPDQILTEYRII